MCSAHGFGEKRWNPSDAKNFAIAARLIVTAAGIAFKDPTTRARIVDHVALTVRRALAADAAAPAKTETIP